MDIIKKIKYCFTYGFNDFSGRASRSEYWGFCLVYSLISYPVEFIGWGSNVIFEANYLEYFMHTYDGKLTYLSLFHMILTIPFLAATFRRLHDNGVSGHLIIANQISMVLIFAAFMSDHDNYYMLSPLEVLGIISMIVFAITGLFLLYWLIKKGDDNYNNYGSNPLTKKQKLNEVKE